MNKARTFEELIAWQKARALTKNIYAATRQRGFQQDISLARQIQRASVSMMSNIAEGFERSGIKEFSNFLSMAKGSCAEVRSQLYVAFDNEHLTESAFRSLMDQAIETARVIGGLRSSLQRLITQRNH